MDNPFSVPDSLKELLSSYQLPDIRFDIPVLPDPELYVPEPESYEDSSLKQQADDIVQRITKDSDRRIAALEAMTEHLRLQAESAAKSAAAAEEDLKVHKQELEDAKAEAHSAGCRAWIAIGISIAAIIAEVILFLAH